MFSADLWRPFDIRPLTYLTFWLNAQLGARNPAGYHAVNLLLHLTAVWLLWNVLRRLVSVKAAWIAAAIFAVHPFQAEPVNYIFARSTLLATVLCLASLSTWIRGHRWWAVAWFGAALLAKEECAAFPLFLLLLELAPSRERGESRAGIRRDLLAVLTMLALSMLAGVRVLLAAASMPGSGVGAGAGIAWHSYALAQGAVILRYLRMFVLPWGFCADPDIRVPAVWLGALAWLAVAALAVLAALRFRRSPAALWFLGGLLLLLPSSSILPAADLASDRRMYLPMIGFAGAAALLLERARPPVLAAMLLLLAGLSTARTATWRSEESLWRDAVEKAPAQVRPRIQLARALAPPDALRLLEEAQRIAPDDARIPAEQGRIYLSLGQPDQALVAFGRALALAPHSADAFNNRGAALLALDQKQAAREDFERALEIDPCQFDARLNLHRLGRPLPAPAACRYSAEQAEALREN
ncbi:MAG: tetratricopeptide repeat protein [Acidobacteriia bacterium]|nr:tetratricopeptide repeat protein [Terriglobia bacterium]